MPHLPTARPGAPDELAQECASDPPRSRLAGSTYPDRGLAGGRCGGCRRPLRTPSVSLAGAATGGRRTYPPRTPLGPNLPSRTAVRRPPDARTAPTLIPSSASNAYAASVAPVRRSHASSTCPVRPSAPCCAVSASGGSAHSTSGHPSCAKELRLSRPAGRSWHPPQTNPTLHATHQRQGRALHPNQLARMGLRPGLLYLRRPHRRTDTLAEILQHSTHPQRHPTSNALHQTEQPSWIQHLERLHVDWK